MGAFDGGVKPQICAPGSVRELKSAHIALREREIAPYQANRR